MYKMHKKAISVKIITNIIQYLSYYLIIYLGSRVTIGRESDKIDFFILSLSYHLII